MNAMGSNQMSRRSLFKCRNAKEVLGSEHFYKLLEGVTTNKEIERILRNIGEKGGDLCSDEDKSTIKTFLERTETRERGKSVLNTTKAHVPLTYITEYVISLFGNNGIDILLNGIASEAGIILFSDRERKLKEIGFPEIPENWKGDKQLEARYNILMKLALENEDWWITLGKQLILSGDNLSINGISFPTKCHEGRIPGSLDYRGKNVDGYFRDIGDYQIIYDFIRKTINLLLGIEIYNEDDINDVKIDDEAKLVLKGKIKTTKIILMQILGIENWLYWLKDDKNNNMYARAFDFRIGKTTPPLLRKTQECFVLSKIEN